MKNLFPILRSISISLRKVRKDLKMITIKVYCLKIDFNNLKESIHLFFKINFGKIIWIVWSFVKLRLSKFLISNKIGKITFK